MLQVEERDSGTESDDEADRTDSSGESSHQALTHTHTHPHTLIMHLSSCDLARRMSYRELPRRPVCARISHFQLNNTQFYDEKLCSGSDSTPCEKWYYLTSI